MRNLLQKITIKTVPVYFGIVLLFVYGTVQPHLFFMGVALILIGEAGRLWAAGHLRKNREVTTTGPYAYVKNPLYIGTFLIMVGFCFLAGQWIILSVGLAVFFFYYAPFKKKREAARLKNIFGSLWDEYDRSVPDYFPRLSPYKNRGSHQWAWGRVVSNSEHQTAVMTLAGIVALGLRLY
ncbi:MAG: isoprenylcysteine carboxylmethyltransferase family protein [Nitrospira sp.]|nr:isoprenylcysteine carboxylmethyltransferase family protein [Candidatus Manganitrophaceae bacterium]HIL34208.1 isoprenylcysteine carboxylmethyltransferase family protein [Candidatus Manganitrophaceae bacterium]